MEYKEQVKFTLAPTMKAQKYTYSSIVSLTSALDGGE
jgi:hypothetical protein